MAKQVLHTEVDGQRVKITNLDKIIYPSISVSKAQVIQYYLDIAPLLLKYIDDRPLTTIRFPDGIDGKRFYSKDKPDWTPDWIDSQLIEHEDKSISYLLAHDKASVVWLANLACLELHPMQFRKQDEMCPDQFIVDLDPDEGMPWDAVKESAVRVKQFLSTYGYTSFVKTSGGKGLHVIVPILPTAPYEKVTEHVKKLAKKFVAQYSSIYTLKIAKTKRKGKILIDIYRNHLTNTTVAPYSLRGKKGAPISMPIRWEDLDTLASSQTYNIQNYKVYLEKIPAPWGDWREYEVPLYDLDSNLPATTDDRLVAYVEKRNLENTPEPPPLVQMNYKDRFVVQLHNASNLHYDLRLEDKGVLWSWAIPKSLPYRAGMKRLAIRTEDHPIKYLTFEGTIPKGQYGAGQMWVYDTGKIEWIKKEEKSLKFTLVGATIQGTYKLFKTKSDDQWLIECEGDQEFFNLDNRLEPMLAESSQDIPQGANIKYEVKWDGIRVVIYVEKDEVKIISRSGRDITSQFPELQLPDHFNAERCVVDGEIVVLDEEGKPLFHEVISRMHTKGFDRINRVRRDKPVTCYLFDLLSLDGVDVCDRPLSKRQQWLATILKADNWYRISDVFDDGQFLFDAIKNRQMEGIMAKDQNAKYMPGSRSRGWLKVKCRTNDEALVIGYTEGQGDRAGAFGALHLAKREDDGTLRYMGKVGTGFNQQKLKKLSELIFALPESEKLITDSIEEAYKTHWVEPKYTCELNYASMSSNNTYREPVFIKIKK